MFLRVTLKCSVTEQLRRQLCSDADRNESIETKRRSKKSKCYELGMAFAQLLGKGGHCVVVANKLF
jgi:hypothetical protein